MKLINDYDKWERILIILIMLLELVIIFRAILMDTMIGLGFWLLFHGLDFIIAKVHDIYFRDQNNDLWRK